MIYQPKIRRSVLPTAHDIEKSFSDDHLRSLFPFNVLCTPIDLYRHKPCCHRGSWNTEFLWNCRKEGGYRIDLLLLFIVANSATTTQSFYGLVVFDGVQTSSFTGSLMATSSVLFGSLSLKATAGSHTIKLELCTTNTCTAFLQTISFKFTVRSGRSYPSCLS